MFKQGGKDGNKVCARARTLVRSDKVSARSAHAWPRRPRRDRVVSCQPQGWRKRWFVLQNEMLIYYKAENVRRRPAPSPAGVMMQPLTA